MRSRCVGTQKDNKKKIVDLLTLMKVPERWYRRKFDLVGASHQVFHILVVVAALTYTKGILQAFDYVHGNDHTCQSTDDVAFHR